MDLMLIADGRDGAAFDEVEAQQPDFVLSGMLAADAGGVTLVVAGVFIMAGWLPGHSLAHQVKWDIPTEAGHLSRPAPSLFKINASLPIEVIAVQL